MQKVKVNLSDNLEIEVEGNYYPEEHEVRYYQDGSGYPGCASSFQITNLTITNGNLLDLIDNMNGNLDLWEYLEELTIKEIENE